MLLTSLPLVIPLLSALLAQGLAIFVLSRNWKAWPNRWLAIGLTTMAVQQGAMLMLGFAGRPDWQLSLFRVELAAGAAIPPVWLAFGLSFGQRNGQSQPAYRRAVLFGLVAVLSVAWIALALGQIVQPVRLKDNGPLLFSLDSWGKAHFAIYVVGLAIVLGHFENLYRSATRTTRWQIKFLILGVFVAFTWQIVTASSALLYGFIHLLHPLLNTLAFLLAEGMIAFSLVRHRLLDVDIFVSRYVIYRSLTLALIGGYLLSLGVVAEIFRWFDVPLDLLAETLLAILGAAALALMLLSENIRWRVKSIIHAHFFKHKYDYRNEWMEYTRRLSRTVAIPEIAAETVNRILEVMWVRQVAMYTLGESAGQMTLVHQVGYDSLPIKLELDTTVAKAFQEQAKRIPSVAENGNSSDVTRELSGQLFGEILVGLLVPVAALDALAGLLVVGPELSGKAFGTDDRDLLRAVAAQAGALILNARLAQEASEGREMQAVAILSAYVAHDLKNAVSMLSMLAENAKFHIAKPEFQADAIRTLSEVTTKMRTLLATLSASRERAVGQVQLVNLASAVGAWIREIEPQLPLRIRIETRLSSTPDVRVAPEQLRSVLHNLLLNSVEAIPDEGKIQVETGQENGQAALTVTDTGRGMTPEFILQRLFRPFQTTKQRGLGIGLYQCRHIVQSFGGTLTAESQEGKGTRMVVRLPTEAGSEQLAASSCSSRTES